MSHTRIRITALVTVLLFALSVMAGLGWAACGKCTGPCSKTKGASTAPCSKTPGACKGQCAKTKGGCAMPCSKTPGACKGQCAKTKGGCAMPCSKTPGACKGQCAKTKGGCAAWGSAAKCTKEQGVWDIKGYIYEVSGPMVKLEVKKGVFADFIMTAKTKLCPPDMKIKKGAFVFVRIATDNNQNIGLCIHTVATCKCKTCTCIDNACKCGNCNCSCTNCRCKSCKCDGKPCACKSCKCKSCKAMKHK